MNRNYLIKFWIFTLLLAPLSIFLYEFIIHNDGDSFFNNVIVYLLFVIVSIVVSIPTLAICDLVLWYLITKKINPIFTKITMIVFTLVGITITMMLVDGRFSLELILPYSITAVITGLFVKINNVPNTSKPIEPMNS